mmetsp:Transcript_127155/g.406845  ORF Transcript_127155/g.406845 Transcript_127155/m.406845 type:complete len:919 (-) Transcript_127155:143-2899(-)
MDSVRGWESPRSAGVGRPSQGGGNWDCSRGIRSLREASSRCRTEEASLLRRNAEEIERCALRRQTEEALALESLLTGFHEAVEGRLERQFSQCAERLAALELFQRTEAERSEALRGELAAQALRAVQDALQLLEGSLIDVLCDSFNSPEVAACTDSEKSGIKDEDVTSPARFGANIKAVARSAAKSLVDGQLSELQTKLSAELAQCSNEVRELAARFAVAETSVCEVRASMSEAIAMSESVRDRMTPCMEELEQRVDSVKQVCLSDMHVVSDTLTERLSAVEAESRNFSQECGTLGAELQSCQSIVVRMREDSGGRAGAAEDFRDELRSSVEGLAAASREELVAVSAGLRDEIEEAELFIREEAASSLASLQCMEAGMESRMAELASGAAASEAASEAAAAVAAGVAEEAARLAAELAKLQASTSAEVSSVAASREASGEQASERLTAAEAALEGMLREEASSNSKAAASMRAELGTLREELEAVDARGEQRLLERTARMEAAWKPQAQGLSEEMQQLRSSTAATASEQRASDADSAQALGSLAATCNQLSEEVSLLKQQGLTHNWCIPKCLQRVQYLSLDAEPGLWMDSPEFSLGCLGRSELRLYPRGAKDGDGQCAIGLHVALGPAASRTVPLQVELHIAGLRRRATSYAEETGGTLYLATGFGSLDAHIGESEEVSVGIEIPFRPWGSRHCTEPSGLSGLDPRRDEGGGPFLSAGPPPALSAGGGPPAVPPSQPRVAGLPRPRDAEHFLVQPPSPFSTVSFDCAPARGSKPPSPSPFSTSLDLGAGLAPAASALPPSRGSSRPSSAGRLGRPPSSHASEAVAPRPADISAGTGAGLLTSGLPAAAETPPRTGWMSFGDRLAADGGQASRTPVGASLEEFGSNRSSRSDSGLRKPITNVSPWASNDRRSTNPFDDA